MFKTLFFSRVTPLIKKGRTTPLKLNDLPEVDKLWNPKSYIKEFDELNSDSNLLFQILKILFPQGKKLLFLIFFILFFKMISPVLIHKLIQAVKLAADGEVSLFYGLSVAFSLGLVQLLSAVINQHYVFHSVTSTQSAVNGLNQRIFKSILNNNNEEVNKGELINRVSTDSELAGAILWGVGELLQIVLTIILTSALLFYYLGSVAWVPLIVLSLLFPVSRLFSKKFASIHGNIMSNRDERVGKMSQFLEGIKVIKSFVWEKVVGHNIEDIRHKEIKCWRKLSIIKSFSTGSYLFFSLLVSFLSFALYTRGGNTLSAELAFTCLTLFSFLEPCFRQLPKVLGEISSASVAAKRIAQALDVKEVQVEHNEANLLSLKNVSVVKNNITLLDNISIDIKEGQKVAIVGQVGSGKTTLINTLLGHHKLSQGSMIQSYKNISLVTQDPFLFIGSIAKNITFSDEGYQSEKLQQALMASCLDEDLRLFPGGEHFELIENGGNLSGGQKQRVNLARAAYHDSDLILLDDPLSALDPRTEDQVIDRLILDHWEGKTIVVSTQRLKHLDKFDIIIFLKSGKVEATGSLSELLNSSTQFKSFVSLAHSSVEESPVREVKPPKMNQDLTPIKNNISEEDQSYGEISFALYLDYLKAMARFSKKNFHKTVGSLIVISVLAMLVPILQNKILSTWTQTGQGKYLFIYGGLGLLAVGMGVLQHFYWSNKAITASESLHDRALKGVLKTQMNYFDANPSGRILNRFSRDLDAVEKDLSWSLEEAFMAFLNSLGALLVMLFIMPFMIVAVSPVLLIYWSLQKSYRACMREAKRLMSISRSPRFTSIQEACAGSTVIKTYKAYDFFKGRFESALGDYQKAFFGVVLINRWFSIRIPLISSILSISAALAVITMGSFGTISSGIAGMILIYASRFWDSLNWTVRAFGEAESQMTSVERLNELALLSPEVNPDNSQSVTSGEIVFQDVFARYSESAPDVLKGTSFKVAPGEKVGVIGRTGAGKSTLFSLLHRFITAHKGDILIDNTSINGFTLDELRTSISTIPQNPVLFSGTIRSNLDPYQEFCDEELHAVLRKSKVDFLTEGLDSVVFESGINFSRGQRQLICLARALVRRAKIIIVDEATASIDAQTDALIRDILMKECPQITVLIIAHKMESISECDKIIEMGEGRVLSVNELKADEGISA